MGYGEAPLPGTDVYDRMKTDPTLFQFLLHKILDLPEALTAGREHWYLQHFYGKLGYKPTAVDTEYFAPSLPGARGDARGVRPVRRFRPGRRGHPRCAHGERKAAYALPRVVWKDEPLQRGHRGDGP